VAVALNVHLFAENKKPSIFPVKLVEHLVILNKAKMVRPKKWVVLSTWGEKHHYLGSQRTRQFNLGVLW